MEEWGIKEEEVKDTFTVLVNVNQILYFEFKYKHIDVNVLLRLLFIADQQHLCQYASTIIRDQWYLGDDNLPRPRRIYSMLFNPNFKFLYDSYFSIENNFIYPKQIPDLDYLSFASIEVINMTLHRYMHKSIDELNKLVVRGNLLGYISPGEFIPEHIMAKCGGANDSMVNYIMEMEEIDEALE